MKINDIVEPLNDAVPLHAGSDMYTHAIVVSLSPFILMSEKGDMVWYHRLPGDFMVTGRKSTYWMRNHHKRRFQEEILPRILGAK